MPEYETPPTPTSAGESWSSARRILWWWAAGWTLVALVVGGVILYDSHREQVRMARILADAICRKDLAFHAWNANPGVYAPVGDKLPPDPLLRQVPDRDLVTTNGLKLTLVRPEYLARLSVATPGTDPTPRSRLTSLKPLAASGTPDPWETKALRQLDLGTGAVQEAFRQDGHPMLRYMAEVVAQTHCLKCHEGQGFRLGDLMGGVTVTVPIEPAQAVGFRHENAAVAGLSACWLLGLVGLQRVGHELRRRLLDRQAAHEQLQERERRFRTLAEEAPVGIFEAVADGRCTYVNRRWRDMAGLSPATARDSSWMTSIHPQDREAVSAAWTEHVRSGNEWHGSFRCVHPDGAVTWIQGSSVALRDGSGRVTGYLGVHTDLTQRMRAEEALRESETRFRLVFEEGPLGLVLTDPKGGFIQVNKAFAEMLGYSAEELCYWSLTDVSHPDDLPQCVELLERSQQSPQSPFRLEQRYRRKDGETVWASLTAVYLQRADGQPLWRLGMVQDTTERRLGESRLREQAALLDIAQDAICVQSLGGQIEFWNPAAERLYGWTREEAVGARGEDLLFARVSRELLEARADVLTQGFWSGELQHAARGGRTIQVDCRFSLVSDSHGKPKSILIVSTDLTEKKRLEQQFLRAQRMECIGALASGVAHDLNNVFAPILMVADFLAGRPVNASDRELIELLRNSADRGAGVVRQLLAFARGQEIAQVELRVDHLLKEMGRLAQKTFPKSIQFSAQPASDLWPVVGDVTQIHQVLLNLCVNARDAMPKGGRLTIEARNIRTDAVFCQMNPDAQPGPYVLIEVIDTGEGIPAAIRDRIFDPFFTTKPAGQGTGLGLSTVLKIVKAHHGFVQVVSDPGQGTRFRVFLPAAGQAESDAGSDRPTPPPSGHGETILVLDDEEAICRVARQVLVRHGYSPLTAQDGVDAITLFVQRQSDIRVVITDMMMPGMDGAAFIRAIRKIAPEVPVLAMSGLPVERHEAELSAHKQLAFLEKPFTGEALVKALHDLLHPSSAPEPRPSPQPPLT